jgi:hypothetical protein
MAQGIEQWLGNKFGICRCVHDDDACVCCAVHSMLKLHPRQAGPVTKLAVNHHFWLLPLWSVYATISPGSTCQVTMTYDTACEVAGRPRQTARGGVAYQAFILLAMRQRLASLWLSPRMSPMLGTMCCCGEMQGNNGLGLILPPTSYHRAHASRRKNNAQDPIASSSDVSSRIVTAREIRSMVRPSSVNNVPRRSNV